MIRGVRRDDIEHHLLQPGEYRLEQDGSVSFNTPNDCFGRTRVGTWEHTVHEDGTITIYPSLRVTVGKVQTWHGYLERGMWREV